MPFSFETVLFFLTLHFETKYFNNYKRCKFCFKDCIFYRINEINVVLNEMNVVFVLQFVSIVESKYMRSIISLIIYNCNGDEFYLNRI